MPQPMASANILRSTSPTRFARKMIDVGLLAIGIEPVVVKTVVAICEQAAETPASLEAAVAHLRVALGSPLHEPVKSLGASGWVRMIGPGLKGDLDDRGQGHACS